MSEAVHLTIDSDAELERLCRAQLQGSWQLPAELVRCALRLGAREVDVRLRRRGLTVSAAGASVRDEVLAALGVALDAAVASVERHRALVLLERSGLLALPATAVLGGTAVLETPAEGGSRRVVLARGGRRRGGAPVGSGRLEIRVRGLLYPRRRARAWLVEACRFVPRPVRVDRRTVGGVPGRCLAQGRVDAPLPVWLAVPAAADVPGLWLLDHGVVAARATVPGFPAFWMAVEMSGAAPIGASAAAFRHAVGPTLPALLDAAAGLLVRLAGRIGELPPADACRVSGLLLEAAAAGLRRGEIEQLPFLPLVTGAEVDEDRVAPRRLRELAAADGSVLVISPGAEERALATEGRLGIVLAEAHTEALTRVTGLRAERAAERREGWAARARERAGRSLRRVAGLGRSPRPVARDRLTPGESALARVLDEALDGASGLRAAVLVEGKGAVRADGARLLVPRSNPEVVRTAAAVAADPALGYAAAVLLLCEVGEPATGLRRRCVARMAGSGSGASGEARPGAAGRTA